MPSPDEVRVVVVTGALGMLGARFVDAFARTGSNVVLLDLDGEACESAASALQNATGARCYGFACDVSSPASVDQAVGAVVRTAGHIDVLINNAASKSSNVRNFFAPFEEYSLETWREVMAVNIDGMFLMAQRVGRELISRGCGGALVQVSSIYGLVGPDARIYEGSDYLGGAINTPGVYAASKAAVVGLTRYLATHWAQHRIRVNCLAPGGVRSGQNDAFAAQYSARVPLRRMATADEIAAGALFLASQESSYVTGQVLAVDGGLTAW